MVTPDYQEFANRAATEYRYNTVICGVLASREMPKSPERCAIATLPDRHESGTFCPDEDINCHWRSYLPPPPAITALATLIDPVTGSLPPALPSVFRSPCRPGQIRGLARRSGSGRVPANPRSSGRIARCA